MFKRLKWPFNFSINISFSLGYTNNYVPRTDAEHALDHAASDEHPNTVIERAEVYLRFLEKHK